jgi:uncharacterized protein
MKPESDLQEPLIELFASMGLVWLTRPRIESGKLLHYLEKGPEAARKLPYYRRNRKTFETLADTYGPQVLRGCLPSLRVDRVSDEIGWGLFAGEQLAGESLVGEYTGVIKEARRVTAEDADKTGHYPDDWSWDYPVELPGLPPLEIDAIKEGNPLRFVNHALFPNLKPDHFLLGAQWVVVFIAVRDIAPGEELTIDYGDQYWSGGFRELVLRDDELIKIGSSSV